MRTKAYAARSPTSALEPFELERRSPGVLDVAIEINQAFERVARSDVRYRFVIDAASLE